MVKLIMGGPLRRQATGPNYQAPHKAIHGNQQRERAQVLSSDRDGTQQPRNGAAEMLRDNFETLPHGQYLVPKGSLAQSGAQDRCPEVRTRESEEIFDLTKPSEIVDDGPAFHLFPKLPTELQISIWEFARPPARVIKPLLRKQNPKDDYQIYSNAPVPSLLHACSQSRTIALKWYTLTFSNCAVLAPRAQIYFDFSRGYLYKCNPLSCTCKPIADSYSNCGYIHLEDEDSDRVRKLCVETEVEYPNVISFRAIEAKHQNLREIMVVSEDKTMKGSWAEMSGFEDVEKDGIEVVDGKKRLWEAYERWKKEGGMRGDGVTSINWSTAVIWRGAFTGTVAKCNN